ncbi:acetolactate decarboxylase [Pedobacter polaris]|uniref:Alpha-acetolactate decarboxylase n=1 Tax=Pedobacter polaris TaxID=2571273 RepID=A0A4U1CVW7_9SPHI|nr:acetolactate decarboxylase [Pedobacter polaris]TKC10379.1 acetolactate decarboxylase [Pedobacter polaris]
MFRTKICVVLLSIFLISSVKSQTNQSINPTNNLYTAGHASAFIGGLYNAFYSYKTLKLHGNFGLGAPDLLDGELLILDGKIYQTQASGKTFEINDNHLTPFAVVNFFNADQTIKTTRSVSKERLYSYLDSILPNQNAIYAIHIKGTFKNIKTRAFPPVKEKPYLPLAEMLPLQQFFTFKNIEGDLVGYRIPAHMEGPNISGYHFHFLSADKKSGGHIIELLTDVISIEIDLLNSFTVALPQTKDFAAFDLKKDRSEEIKRVENGKKN